jgi:hypothetical protein
VLLEHALHEVIAAWYEHHGLPMPAPERLLADLVAHDSALAPEARVRASPAHAPLLMPCAAPLPGEPEWPAHPHDPRPLPAHVPHPSN